MNRKGISMGFPWDFPLSVIFGSACRSLGSKISSEDATRVPAAAEEVQHGSYAGADI